MINYSKKTNRLDISIDSNRKKIIVKQKWKYSWLNAPGTTTWTYSDKKDFHSKVDNLIWNSWGNFFFLKTTGTSNFSKKHKSTRWDIDFDIEWVTNNEHWNVNVTKYPNNYIGNPTSSVRWNARIIKLDTKDTSTRKRVRNNTDYFQTPVVHEFGHSVGNSIFASPSMHGDEYKSSSNYYQDKISLMNIGNKLRDRHLDYVISELNTIIPNTNFKKY